jgi:hypothetical protein
VSRTPGSAARRVGHMGVLALAGWLFADLLLVLALVAMGGQPDPLAAQAAHATPSASRGASPRPSHTKPKPRPTPRGPRAVEKRSVRFTVHGADRGALVRQLQRATKGYRKRKAAIVLTFGGGAAGEEYAAKVNSLLTAARPGLFPRGTTTRDYLNLSGPSDTATLEVFFYTYPR